MNPVRLAIRPGVAAIVRDEHGRLLLHRRVVGKTWAPPSGTVEPGEELRAALRRELEEETRLRVAIRRLVGVYSDPQWQIVDYPDGRSVHFVTSVFLCRKVGGRLEGSDEGSAWAWFEPGELPDDLLGYARVWLEDALAERSSPAIR